MDADASGLVGWLDVVDEVNDVISAETQGTLSGGVGGTLLHDPVTFTMLMQHSF